MRPVILVVLLAFLGFETAASRSPRLPQGVHPVLGCWFWKEAEFESEGYKPFLDEAAQFSHFDLLTTSLRAPQRELTDPAVHRQIADAARYAENLGLGIVMDLDVRLARQAFRDRYPDEMQEMLRVREFPFLVGADTVCRISSEVLDDHYTHNSTPYLPLSGRVVRVFKYRKTHDGIETESVAELKDAEYRIDVETAREVGITIQPNASDDGWTICLAAAFTHLTPDVFAPHLDEFQAEILALYSDVPLRGACKDEWGFPPSFDGCPDKNDYWFSEPTSEAYLARTGRDFVRDCLLMTYGEPGRETERANAVDDFNQMILDRHTEIESHFYRWVKQVFGRSAVVATHPTWYPFPGVQEFKKNGLDWWAAPRDWAQTDELTPYAARTALAKKWNSPVWYNMYYSKEAGDYQREIWRGALTGGRVNFHPPWPRPEGESLIESTRSITGGALTRGDCRIRLLNFITRSPLDCPVAVVFGHLAAMNWARENYADVGMELVDALWEKGYPADLIPSTEFGEQGLKVSDSGVLKYGSQEYAAVVLHHCEPESEETIRLLDQAVQGTTRVYILGDGLPHRAAGRLDPQTAADEIAADLKARGISPQEFETEDMVGFGYSSRAPVSKGNSRMVDGTIVLAAGAGSAAGDPLVGDFDLGGRQVGIDAVGLTAVRWDADGALDALAAGGLKRFESEGLRIDLKERLDFAIWKVNGRYKGVVQGWEGPIPDALLELTDDWSRLGLPDSR